MVLEDSVVNGLNEYELSKNQNVKIESFSRHTTEDRLGIVKSATRCKPDGIIIHTETNGITRDMNMMKSIKKIVKSIRDCSEYMQVSLSGIINREDDNYSDKISEINTRMASYSKVQGLIFININNMNGTCLNRGRLHLNKKGYSKFSLNLIESVKSI